MALVTSKGVQFSQNAALLFVHFVGSPCQSTGGSLCTRASIQRRQTSLGNGMRIWLEMEVQGHELGLTASK